MFEGCGLIKMIMLMDMDLHYWRMWTYMIEGCGLTWLKGKDLHDWRMWTYTIEGGELTLLIGVDSQCTLLMDVELKYW